MKIYITALLFALTTFSFFGQETDTLKKINEQFTNHYNDKNSKGIFDMFSKEMQEALPLSKVEQVVNGLHFQAGKIESTEYIKHENNYAVYKANFENTPLFMKISIDSRSLMNGLLFVPYKEDNTPKLERNITKLILPFHGKWNVFWGGDNVKDNYHVDYEAQKGAFDIMIMDETGSTHKGTGEKNEDYYAFGKEIIAPCDAEVVVAVDGIKDNIPGEMNPTFLTGNTVILKTEKNEYLVFAHFKQYSVNVKQGDMVKKGDLLGLCGNSGNSTETHLHFHIQNVEGMHDATGAKCYFDNILVNGEIKTDYSPIKNDVIENIQQ